MNTTDPRPETNAPGARHSMVRFEFLSVLAHELKAPINAVEGYLNLMRDGALQGNEPLQREVLERCSERICGMRKLIVDLLDLTRIESGQRARLLTAVDLAALAREALETARGEADPRGIRLELSTPEPLLITGDRSELEIMLNNLISNAVKYNRDGGAVTITLQRRKHEIVLQVTDTGIGMSREEAARLFKEFVRVKNEKTQHILGSGLGLSILKKLALLYDGAICVESEPDRGSTFTITLRGPTRGRRRSRGCARPCADAAGVWRSAGTK